ncbi:Conserved hypothetical protein [Herminiimonas arsenicoxydans]|uniref:Uncharacterized protein n=1 Tax=Herminiimonas arsenicoxydans TaxID=204773 RepID=A4G7D1_HERAR|nr:Conserved hypothetical protein [Herminiimonas arsenicoxydans]
MNQDNQNIQKKSTGRGGARPNAGRKKSATTVRTREIAEKVISEAKEGESPLEVMMRVMAGFLRAAETASNSEDADERKSSIKLLVLAKDAASAAAPYVHPRLAAIDHTTNGKDMVQTTGVLVAPSAMSEADWEKQSNA